MQRFVHTLLAGLILASVQALPASETAVLPPGSPPRQILIEAVLLTAPAGATMDFGPVGSPRNPLSDSRSGGFRYTAGMGQDLDSLVSQVARNPGVRILQRPRIETADGVSASIFMGETRPDPEPGARAYPSAPVNKQFPSGVTLEITPQLKAGGLVLMDLHLKIERVEENVSVPHVGEVPVTSTSDTRTQVMVRDRNVFLMGGLIMNHGKTKLATKPAIRFPKDLPLPSTLVSRKEAAPAQELLLVLRPVLLSSEKEAGPPPHAPAAHPAQSRP